MPAPDAPEPLDTTRGVAAPAGRSAERPGDAPARTGRDLSAIPAFLRSRATTAAPAQPHRAHPAPAPPLPDPAALPIAGIAPRRLVVVGLVVVFVWLVVAFGRQVAEASAASSRADQLRGANAGLTTEVDALQRELRTIQDERYIAEAARAFRLGTPHEVPFALEAGAPELGTDAPGSASVRLGAETSTKSPLDSWLDVLFGPGG